MRWASPVLLLTVATAVGCAHRPTLVRQLDDPPGLVSAVAWSPDGSLIAAGGYDGTVRIWQVRSGRKVAERAGYRSHGMDYDATGLAFSPDGRILAFGGERGVVWLWDHGSGNARALIGQTRALLTAAFSPDGCWLMTAAGGMTYPHGTEPTSVPVRRISRGASGKPVVEPMTVVVFDVGTGRPASRVDAGGYVKVVFSPDAERFAGPRFPATAATTWPVRAPDVKQGRLQVRQTRTGAVVADVPALGWTTQWSPDGRLLLNGSAVYAVPSGMKARDIGPNGRVFTDGGERVLVADTGVGVPSDLMATTPWLRPVYVDVTTGRRHDAGRYVLDAAGAGLQGAMIDPILYSPDRRFIVDRELRLWQVPR